MCLNLANLQKLWFITGYCDQNVEYKLPIIINDLLGEKYEEDRF